LWQIYFYWNLAAGRIIVDVHLVLNCIIILNEILVARDEYWRLPLSYRRSLMVRMSVFGQRTFHALRLICG